MHYITMGQLNIPIIWFAFFTTILYSDFKSKGTESSTNKTIEQLFFLYVMIWKSSYILFSWSNFLKAPLSLLYFDGGGKGHAFALVVISILLYRKRAQIDWQGLWHYWARFTAVYQMISYSFQEHWWFIAGLWFILLVIGERKYNNWLLLAQWLLVLWLGGFSDHLTQVHGIVILTLLFKTKQAQQVATLGIVSLVAIMLTDVQQITNVTASSAIDLPTTTGEHYRLTEQEQTH